RQKVENQPNLILLQQAVDDLIIEGEKVKGVVTQMGLRLYADAVILTTGTFLDGKIHIGMTHYSGGRAGDPAALTLARRLREMPLRVGRLKTGTPPRIDGRSIDYSELQKQPTDNPCPVMSYRGTVDMHPRQVPCFITYTNEKTHALIQAGLNHSPLYS